MPREVAYRHEKLTALQQARKKLIEDKRPVNPDTLSEIASTFLALKPRTFRAFIYNHMTKEEQKDLGLFL